MYDSKVIFFKSKTVTGMLCRAALQLCFLLDITLFILVWMVLCVQ